MRILPAQGGDKVYRDPFADQGGGSVSGIGVDGQEGFEGGVIGEVLSAEQAEAGGVGGLLGPGRTGEASGLAGKVGGGTVGALKLMVASEAGEDEGLS